MSIVYEERLKKFNDLKFHAWYSKSFKKLTADEQIELLNIIKRGDGMDRDEYTIFINRYFLSVDKKPKHWTEMSDLLLASR